MVTNTVDTHGLLAVACKQEATSRLEKALKLEEDGKPTKFIDYMLDRACQFENAAFDGRK